MPRNAVSKASIRRLLGPMPLVPSLRMLHDCPKMNSVDTSRNYGARLAVVVFSTLDRFELQC